METLEDYLDSLEETKKCDNCEDECDADERFCCQACEGEYLSDWCR